MSPTTETTKELQQNLRESMKLLKTLRDEIRVELHLAGMDVKDQWKRLEHHFTEAEQAAQRVSDASKGVVESAVEAFKTFKKELVGTGQQSAR